MERPLIVGGGPVGLVLACELFRHGVPCRLVEKKTERDVWSKAAAIQPRTLEVLRDVGVVDRILEQGRAMYGVTVHANAGRLAHLAFDISQTQFGYMLGLSQRETEEILQAHLESLGGTLEREIELVEFEQSADGVVAQLRHLDGSLEEVRTPYLIGCDGAHSRTRKVLELPFEGSTFHQRIIQADLSVDFPFEADPHEGQMLVGETGAVGFLPLLGGNRYRLIVMAPPDDVGEELTLADFQRVVDERSGGLTVRLHDPQWMIGFRFHGRIVPRYRVGRVFLAGDAAHIHSPAGGQGMNLGIQDAYNLGWKLALVLGGGASPDLLDSYHAERHGIGATVVRTTDVATKQAIRFMTLRNPVAAAVRNNIVGFVMSSGLFASRVSEGLGGLTVGYEHSPIVDQHHSSVWLTSLEEDRSTEAPDIRDWMRFGKGPGPGQRVPDVALSDDQTLFDVLAGTRHVLLLFDGAATTEAGYRNLSSIARAVRERWGRLVDVHVVVPQESRPEQLDDEVPILFDADFSLHQHFGCGAESLYLVRPDGYVGFRSQPADEKRLLGYLERIFT